VSLDDDEVHAKMAQLAQGFVAKLPARFEQMEAALALCAGDLANNEHWQELRRVLHSLGGAAGTFGLPDLGAAAKDIERRLDERLAQNNWTARDVTMFKADVIALRSSIAR
jgi:HPt (histidine-containing phosphotransfer) domain-containing protein